MPERERIERARLWVNNKFTPIITFVVTMGIVLAVWVGRRFGDSESARFTDCEFRCDGFAPKLVRHECFCDTTKVRPSGG